MKKFLCLLLVFLLYISMCATAEENTNEEVVSNIVTYGPVSFDISDDWVEIGHHTEPNYIGAGFVSASEKHMAFSLTIQDIWNGLMPDETRHRYISSGITQKDFDSLDMANQYMADRAQTLGISTDEIEPLLINGYKFCRLIIPTPARLSTVGVFNIPEYYAVVNGYLINISLFDSVNSKRHDDLMKALESLEIGTIDIITGE